MNWLTWQRRKPETGQEWGYLFVKGLQHNQRGVSKYLSGFACWFPDPNVNMRWFKANNELEAKLTQDHQTQLVSKNDAQCGPKMVILDRELCRWRTDGGQTQEWCWVDPELMPQNITEHQLHPKLKINFTSGDGCRQKIWIKCCPIFKVIPICQGPCWFKKKTKKNWQLLPVTSI